MLAPEFGGIRPWELAEFTPAEETAVHQRARALEQQASEVT